MGEWLCVGALVVFLGLHLWLVVIPKARFMRYLTEAELDREKLDRERAADAAGRKDDG